MNATGDGRAELHGMWSSVAEAWDAHAAFVCARGEVVTRAMLESTAPGPGDHVLELAAGTGGPGLAAAALVGPGGSVVQSDVSAGMAEHAARRARTLGLSGVQTRVLDLERIDEPDGSYDVVLCREGLMLVPDPARALREIRRVLRPGGRLALTVWVPPRAIPGCASSSTWSAHSSALPSRRRASRIPSRSPTPTASRRCLPGPAWSSA